MASGTGPLQAITPYVIHKHDPELREPRDRVDLVRAAKPKTAARHSERGLAKTALAQSGAGVDRSQGSPGNRLEALKADRQGQHSIRINDQWRICFVWDDGGPRDVEIVDYHD